MKKITTAELRKINRGKIYRLIYDERLIARLEIADRLKISQPTVGQDLRDLADSGLISREGRFESTGGRKPQVISCVADAKIGIGIELSRNEIRIVAVDLYGRIVDSRRNRLEYRNAAAYYRTFGRHVNAFCDSLGKPAADILGVGIAIQGLPSIDGTAVSHGTVLLTTGVRVEDFSRHLRLPARLIHDSEAAAYAELWYSKDITNAIYLSLSQYLGGILILNRTIHTSGTMDSGLIEHMRIYPDGERCYCGRKGCFSVYCSADALIAGSGDGLETFFSKLREGKARHVKAWRAYLDHLALGIGNLRMVVSCDVVLGGHIAPYLVDGDIECLKTALNWPDNHGGEAFFVRIARCNKDNVACGAALPFVARFLESVW